MRMDVAAALRGDLGAAGSPDPAALFFLEMLPFTLLLSPRTCGGEGESCLGLALVPA